MLARLLTVLAVIVSLVGTIFMAKGTASWWPAHVGHAGFVLVVLAVVAALMSERQASTVTLAAQVLTAAAAIAFSIVALVKFYETTSLFLNTEYPWYTGALTLATAAFAFGLTLERRRSTGVVACLLAACGVTVGCAVYALTEKANLAAEIWWLLAPVGAFLAAAAAAQHEREGTVASAVPAPTLGPPVLSGAAAVEPAADDSVE
jgi:hypothetical protein